MQKNLSPTSKLQYKIPTRQEIEDLKVGDEALGISGWGRVKEIFARDTDINGKKFVCTYLEYPSGLVMSQSLKEGELIRTGAVTSKHTSAEVQEIEDNMNEAGFTQWWN